MKGPSKTFHTFARAASRGVGHPAAFLTAALLVLVWAVLGPVFGFSNTWQMLINTATTILTFLVVFLIQNTQNRDTDAMQVKLDELIRATGNARNVLLNLEEVDDDEIRKVRENYARLARKARTKAARRPRKAPAAGKRNEDDVNSIPERGE